MYKAIFSQWNAFYPFFTDFFLKFQMCELFSTGIAVENRLSADNRHNQSVQKLRYVFRKVYRIVVYGVQNGHFNQLSRIQRIGKRLQKVVRNPALSDLGNGRQIRRNRFQFASLFARYILFEFFCPLC